MAKKISYIIFFVVINSSKTFFQVLSAIDSDADGMIKIDHVIKVLEMLGHEQVQVLYYYN
jgi:Ca2+-binding EF-hand superfamily protein